MIWNAKFQKFFDFIILAFQRNCKITKDIELDLVYFLENSGTIFLVIAAPAEVSRDKTTN